MNRTNIVNHADTSIDHKRHCRENGIGRVRRTAIAVIFMLILVSPAWADHFTFQARVADAGADANGIFDFTFRLFNVAAGPGQVGPELTADDINLVDGLLVIDLDFGAGVFDGTDLWLEISLKPDADAVYTTLSPRQPINPTPYAHYAWNAMMIPDGGLPANYAQAVNFSNVANQFVGDGVGLANLDATNIAMGTFDAARLPTGGGWALGASLDVDSGTFFVDPASNQVGIGTIAPTAALDVAGTVRMLGFEMPTGASPGQVLTSDASGVGTWQPGLTIPITVNIDSPQTGIDLTNQTGGAFIGRSAGTNPAIRGVALGDGNAGRFESFAAGSTVDVLSALTTSDGVAVKAETQGGGPAGLFVTSLNSNSSTTIRALNNGTGKTGHFDNLNAANPSSVLQVDTNGAGDAVLATMTGNARAGHFRIIAPNPGANISTSLESFTNGAGRAGFFQINVPNPADNTSAAVDAITNGNGDGVRGVNTAVGGVTTGVFGETFSNAGRGVAGIAGANNGATMGVYGLSASPTGIGVQGDATSANGFNFGVKGVTPSPFGTGVHGEATSANGQFAVGVVGLTSSNSGTGVRGSALSANGNTTGVSGTNASPDGRGVFGFAFANNGPTKGVFGQVSSNAGIGVHGDATAVNGSTVGVFGEADSTAGIGVKGEATRNNGNSFAVRGENASNTGTGVYGLVTSANAAGLRVGVKGEFTSGDGVAVLGITPVNTLPSRAIQGVNPSNSGQGGTNPTDFAVAVEGLATADNGVTRGVRGVTDSKNGIGVEGLATSTVNDSTVPPSIGVLGTSFHPLGTGVKAVAEDLNGNNIGLLAIARGPTGTGVFARAPASSGDTIGVIASAPSPDGIGVDAAAGDIGVKGDGGNIGVRGAGTTYGVMSEGDLYVTEDVIIDGSTTTDDLIVNGNTTIGGMLSTSGTVEIATLDAVTGQFDGDVTVGSTVFTSNINASSNATINGNASVNGNLTVGGTISKGGGSFRIDHPLDPEHKYLYHSFIESPDMMNIYNGNVVTDDDGYATIEMPGWFEALNRDFRYQLTVIDDGDEFVFAKVTREMEGNQFSIRTSRARTKVSWQVTGIRQDDWANENRIPVEVDKPMN